MTRKPPTHLTVSEIENIKVLKASGLTNYAVSKRVGRSVKTVKRCCEIPRNSDEIKSLQKELASYFEDLAMRLITSVTDEGINKLNPLQIATSAAICIDKALLIRGDATENISINVLNANIKDRARRRLELQEELQLTEVTTDEKELEGKADNQE